MYMYAYMYACVCVKIECREAEDYVKGLPDIRDFWMSDQKNPCYRSLVKFCKYGAGIFHKMCSFEVSLGLLSLILINSLKESLF